MPVGTIVKGRCCVGRIFIGSIVGALVVFVWGFLSWEVLGLYDKSITSMPNADVVVPVLKTNVGQTGAYFFPPMPENQADPAAMTAWEEQHKAGPIGMLMYRAEGSATMDMMTMVRGFCIYFVASMLLSCVMMAAQLRNFILRMAFVIIAAAFAVMVCHISTWNWMMFPDKYALAMTADTMVGWTIAGFFLAIIVRPKVPVMV
jgi:hypothetical protein